MIKITHAADGFSDGIKAVVIDGNQVTALDKKGRKKECNWDTEWLIRQAVDEGSDLCFEFTPKQ